jgi:hypothetical protein
MKPRGEETSKEKKEERAGKSGFIPTLTPLIAASPSSLLLYFIARMQQRPLAVPDSNPCLYEGLSSIFPIA